MLIFNNITCVWYKHKSNIVDLSETKVFDVGFKIYIY